MADPLNDIVLFEADANPVETGLVTAPVTLPDGWSVAKALELIDALARDLYDEAHTLKIFGLTKSQFAILTANEWFKKNLDQQSADWNKATNVNTRLAIQAALMLEKNFPALSKRLGSQTEPLGMVVALAKLLAEVSGNAGAAAAAKAAEGPRDRFKIVFNLGADIQHFDKEAPFKVADGGNHTLQPLLEAPGMSASIQTDDKGS